MTSSKRLTIKSLLNSNICSEDFKKCVKLIKLWCRRKCYANYLELPMVLFMVVLKNKSMLTNQMNSIEMFRKTLFEFSQTQWQQMPTYFEDFAFDSDHLTEEIYLGAKLEASITLEKVDTNDKQGVIQALQPTCFNERFDLVIALDCSQLPEIDVDQVISLLRKALGDRVILIQRQHFNLSSPKREINPPKYVNIGLLVNGDHAFETITRGPSADKKKAEEFRTFWGEKSELRRFQEGLICESVVWDSSTVADRRAIIGKITKYILNKHFNIQKKFIAISGSQLDPFLWPAKVSPPDYGTGEEANRKIVSNFENLAKKLRAIKELPLSLNSIQGVSPAFRGCEVFPSDLVLPIYDEESYGHKENCITFSEKNNNQALKHLEPINVLAHLETSGKWPSDLEALKRVKAAFILELSSAIVDQYGLICRPQKRYLDVYQESMVFRIHFACAKEVHLMRHTMTPEGMIKTIESPEADELTKFQIHLPIITSALTSVNTRFPTYSAVTRLAKCWISRHLLWDNIDEITVELLVAFLYLHPFPYKSPMSPLVGFIRFLRLLISHSWKTKPLIVNFNDELKREDILEIEEYFRGNRDTLPPIFIATPYDKKQSLWTSSKPLAPVVQRLLFLANRCYDYMQKCTDDLFKADFLPLFQTSTEIYDLTIHLEKNHIPNFNLNLNFVRNNTLSNKQILSFHRRKAKRKTEHFPIVDFNPVNSFLSELRKHFGQYAIFFYDKFGGNRIYLIWKPHTFDSKQLYLSSVNDCKLTETVTKSGKANVVFNAEAVMEDLYILGDGLVTSIDANVAKWD